jgi:hypothetical protein
MNEKHETKGQLKITLRDRTGVIKKESAIENTIVNGGRQLLASHFLDKEAVLVSYMAVGKGVDEPNPNQTALVAEVARKAIIERKIGGNPSTVVFVVDFKYEDTSKQSLLEAGLFTAEKDGCMYSRVKFDSPITITETFSLTLEWSLTF